VPAINPARKRWHRLDCDCEVQGLEVETDDAIYEVIFGQVQIEITGRCNMACRHCRAADDHSGDMSLEQISKVIGFARRYSPNYKEIVLSGGEPFIHDDIEEVLRWVRYNGGDMVTLTTNGSLLESRHLDLITDLAFERLTLSVSLDSLNPSTHDEFRCFPGAHERAVRAIEMITERNISSVVASVRSTLRPEQIAEMPAFAKFAYDAGCQRISFSSIMPAGRSIGQPDLWMTQEQKRRFLETIYELKAQYPRHFNITTNELLKCLIRGSSEVGQGNEIIFDGCPAGSVTFNVNANGDMTPCALLNLPMMNVFGMTIDEIATAYQQSEIVKSMLDMNVGGKCGKCDLKYQCGGCRARAFIHSGDYLGEDPDCWR